VWCTTWSVGALIKEIALFLEGNQSAKQLHGMLKLRQTEIRQRVEEEREHLEGRRTG
jgi:hypothetical protein